MKSNVSSVYILLPVLFLILIIQTITTGCKKEDDQEEPKTNFEVFDDLFSGFFPKYNFYDEPTEMLAHAARITIPGYEPWEVNMGFKDSTKTSEISTNSIFRIGSATKMFTATIILQLWEEGDIELDSSFNYYLNLDAETYPTINEFNGVNIRHLLSHRSGLPRISSTTFFDDYFYTDQITQLERMRYLFTDGHLEFEPGSEYGYRNSNFNVLGLLIEKVTGSQYHIVLKDRIYNKINLNNTYLLDYDITKDNVHIAHGYTQGFDGTDYHGSQPWAAGGMVSTVKDLSAFMNALVDGNLFTQSSTFSMMVTPEPGAFYGLGITVWDTPEGRAYGHGGGIFGFNLRLEYFPEYGTTVISAMSFNGYDFIVTNWYDDFCYPVIREVSRARPPESFRTFGRES